MVDQDLMTATDELVEEIVQFDLVSLVEGVSGLGFGLFSAEFVAQLAGGMLAGRRRMVRFLGEVLAKAGLTGAFIIARRFGGDLLSVLFGMAAVGSAASIILQVIEAVAETAARISTGELGEMGAHDEDTQSDRAAIDDSGYGGGDSAAMSV